MLTAIMNAAVYTGAEIVRGKSLLIRNGRFEALIDPQQVPVNAEKIDCSGNFIAPGLIDLQIAGGGGHLFSDNPTPETLDAIARAIVSNGTTGFLIVIPTNSFEVIQEAIRIIRDYPHPALLGLHLEGPYINPARSGAHERAFIRKSDGTLSGSQLTMLRAVKNCAGSAGLPVEEALRMASTYPARLISAGDRGQITPGSRADIIEFNSDFQLKRVYTKGYLALENEADKINRL
jgi:N-acetylglucosamine-6-phosphate deacetylase